MPKSRSKRRTYTPPPRPRAKPSAPWVGPTAVVLLCVGLIYLLLFYANLLPWGDQDSIGNYNLAIGFIPFVAGLALLTRWR
jgi:Cell division protein CrgA